MSGEREVLRDRIAEAIRASMEEQCDFEHVGLIGHHVNWNRLADAVLDASIDFFAPPW